MKLYHNRTGRTTRMMNEARRLAEAGRAVYVVMASEGERLAMAKAHADLKALGVSFESIGMLSNLDLGTMTLRGAHPNCAVLVDHHALEQRYRAAIDMIHRFDPEPLPHATALSPIRRSLTGELVTALKVARTYLQRASEVISDYYDEGVAQIDTALAEAASQETSTQHAHVDGIAMIAAERARHQTKYDATHDDARTGDELPIFAGLLVLECMDMHTARVEFNPGNIPNWIAEEVSHHVAKGNALEVAGAVIAAEIDRRRRADRRAGASTGLV